jgi:hypothetical protein
MTVFAFRFAQPYAFKNGSFFDWQINPKFIANLEELDKLSQQDSYYPPSIQWNNTTPIAYPLKHMVLWGLGLPLGFSSVLSVIAGVILVGVSVKKIITPKNLETKTIILVAIVTSIVCIFIFQGIQFAKPVRYFVILYPFLALLTAYFLVMLFNQLSEKISRPSALITCFILLTSFVMWPLAFFSIYTRLHSRVTASEWIYQNIPPGSRLGVEYWDDGLPLPLGAGRNYDLYQFEELPMFDPDSDQKWSILEKKFQSIDYIILSSNRVYGSISRLPKRYQRTMVYYKDLFAGKLNFRKVAEFTSRPTIFGFEINDDNADETFTVYDHPKVMVFKKL